MKILSKKKRNEKNQVGDEGQVEMQDNVETQIEDETSTSENSERIRFCSDISKYYHRKLKMYAVQNDMPLNDALEKLIECHCDN